MFDPPAAAEDEEDKGDVIQEEEEEEDGSKKDTIPKKEAPEKLPYHIMVDEVVRNTRMHYFKVPRLGSFMAINLEYDACLHEEAFDDGVREMINVYRRRAEQEDEKAEWEKEEQIRKEQKEQDEEASAYQPEDKDWPSIKASSYKKQKVQFVVCMNTCG